MKNISETLKREYERVIREYAPSDRSDNGCLSEIQIIRNYFVLTDYFIKQKENVFFGIKSFNLLSSAVNRQFVEYGGVKKWSTVYQKMAVLLYGLDKNHAFEDCNKRTALLSLLLHLEENKLTVTCHKTKLEELCVRIAANELSKYKDYSYFEKFDEPEVEFIAHFLRNNTRRINKRFYSITYQQFDTRLREFGYHFENPKGNYIDVVRDEYTIRLLGIIKKRVGPKKVIQVGFPGWKKQVNEKAAKCILKECRLTNDDGVDSDVFFKGEEPLYSLIEEYKGPLKRLKDK